LVNDGEVEEDRIDDAVKRILQVKAAMGLLDPGALVTADKELQSKFGSQEHRDVARQAVRESVVLLKNQEKTLPISSMAKRIHVVGKAADDIGIQCGGWTIEWQGKVGDVTTGGTTLLAAVSNAVPRNTEVTYSADGTGGEGADVVVAVVGERPYAEGNGDDEDLSLSGKDLEVIANAKKAGAPLVVVLYSGRPLAVSSTIADADAFVAAWLPGTEGDGIADILLGKFAPTGKLSFTWPRGVEQEPINLGDKEYDPLFPFGFGLSYSR
jgi:beta-glucosidase